MSDTTSIPVQFKYPKGHITINILKPTLDMYIHVHNAIIKRNSPS